MTHYVAFDDCSQLLASYTGKVTSVAFLRLKDAVFEELDSLGSAAGKVQVTFTEKADPELFGKDIAEIIDSKLDFVKKTAVLRTVFAGQNILVDYNWSIKVVPGSDQLKKANLHLVSLEFLVMDRMGNHKRHISEFSEVEFTKFCHQLSALQT